MNAEVDDPDVYHQDFTTASSWEEFVDHIEKTIIDWKLNQPRARQPLHSRYLEGEWETKTVEIDFEGTLRPSYEGASCHLLCDDATLSL